VSVIVGIRPEHFEDAALVGHRPDGHTFKATVDVLESVGSEYYAHFTVRSEPLPAIASGAVIQDHGSAEDRRFRDGVPMVARLGRASRVRQGDEVELWFDTTQIHLFDDHGGQNLLANERRAKALAPPPGARALTTGSGTAPAPDKVAWGVG
jgi:multiple sugar transport system ATP-binding protein